MANIYRIRMPDSTYGAQLRGIVNTPTEGLLVAGTYNSAKNMHEFPIVVTGRYQLYYNTPSDSNYVIDSNWGGSSGKLVLGDDFDTHFNGHGKGPGGKVQPDETTFAAGLEAPTVS